MTRRQREALRAKIDASPQLSALETALRRAIGLRLDVVSAEPNNVALDPITILMIISVVIQIIRFCRERNNRPYAEIFGAVRAASDLPARRTIRLRRRLNLLWAEYCKQHNLPQTEFNPFLSGVYAVSSTIDEETAAELLALADY